MNWQSHGKCSVISALLMSSNHKKTQLFVSKKETMHTYELVINLKKSHIFSKIFLKDHLCSLKWIRTLFEDANFYESRSWNFHCSEKMQLFQKGPWNLKISYCHLQKRC